MSVADLKEEIARVEKELKKIQDDPSKPFCPADKFISAEIGHAMGLYLRQKILEDALLFVEHGPPPKKKPKGRTNG